MFSLLVQIGFAINLDLLIKSDVLISTTSHPGYVENDFLDKLITLDEMEPRANGCKMVNLSYSYVDDVIVNLF